MSVPTITALPPAPNPTASPATFDNDTTNFLGALPTLVGQTNTLATYLEARASDAASAASTAAAQAATATARANQAATSASEAQSFRNSAQTAAAAAQSSAGLPSLAGNAGKRLAVNAAGNGVLWTDSAIGGVEVDLYGTAGTFTWTKAPDDRFVIVRCWGAGGGGGRSSTYGGGGAGGQYVERVISAADLPPTVTVTVGDGGAGASTNTHGQPGGDSSFGAYVNALGGSRGRNDQRFSSPAGAKVDNAPTSAASALIYAPPSGYGAASATYTGGDAVEAGAGGGGATSTSGTAGGVSQFGGDGGAGSSGGGDGQPGQAPGGGGGGARTSSAATRAGDGAVGRVEIIRIKG